MYNRYTPQPDGTYKRKTVQMQNHINKPPIPKETHSPIQDTLPPPPPSDIPKPGRPPKQKNPSHQPEISAGAFLKDLLPKNLDTGDLLIIILLLLIAADGHDDHGSALLTLALYLFL